MAGHSKFKNIQFRKGAQDKKRSKLFSKLAREITAAAKMGMPDPAMNPRLRTAVAAARAQNMPKDNIERAIKKSQEAGGANYEEVRYEGFGAGGVGVIVEALTDNRNRTASEVRSIFTKNVEESSLYRDKDLFTIKGNNLTRSLANFLESWMHRIDGALGMVKLPHHCSQDESDSSWITQPN